MNILITGGLGFIGSNLVKSLINKKSIKQITIVDNFSKSNINYLDSIAKYKLFSSPKKYLKNKSKIQVIRADIKDFSFALKITKNIDYIVHLAAESGVDISISAPFESFSTNVQGSYNYLEASRVNNVKRFIFASSGAVFGDTKPPLKETNIKSPISPYGSSKLSMETFCETYSNVFNLNTTILRFSNAYGPYSSHKRSIVAEFISNILTSKPLIINGDGNITRDYIYVNDICDVICKMFHNKSESNIYHVGTGKETSIKNLIKTLNSIVKNNKYESFKVEYKKARVGDMKKNYTSISKIKKSLKWMPKINLDKGLKQTFEWFAKQK